jgi:hypothetical protein
MQARISGCSHVSETCLLPVEDIVESMIVQVPWALVEVAKLDLSFTPMDNAGAKRIVTTGRLLPQRKRSLPCIDTDSRTSCS